MFADNSRDKDNYLKWIARETLNRRLGNHVEARELMAQWIKQDRRFDGLDPVKLAQRADEQQSTGARLDLSDPRLMGRPPRPLERDQSW
jgi:hypothetical protein